MEKKQRIAQIGRSGQEGYRSIGEQPRPNSDHRAFQIDLRQANNGDLEQGQRETRSQLHTSRVVLLDQRFDLIGQIRRCVEITREVHFDHRPVDSMNSKQRIRQIQGQGEALNDAIAIEWIIAIRRCRQIEQGEKKMIRRREQRRRWSHIKL